jgi:hypothetical protein
MKRVISCQIAGLALDSPADDRMNDHSRELRHAIRGLVRAPLLARVMASSPPLRSE